MTIIATNLSSVRKQIDAAAITAGRDPQSVRLITVSKFHAAGAVHEAIGNGQRLFGENRVQEAKEKFVSLRQEFPDIELHLIGPLQTNKTDDAVRVFDTIQTVDRPNLADALAKSIRKVGRTPKLYIEVNVGNEQQKAGIAPDGLGNFIAYCQDSCGLLISGLMCIPPQGHTPDSYFATMRELANSFSLPNLSMGMSSDFEAAIRHGATEVRVGTAIFGERPTKP
jgi:hypothetical protein